MFIKLKLPHLYIKSGSSDQIDFLLRAEKFFHYNHKNNSNWYILMTGATDRHPLLLSGSAAATD